MATWPGKESSTEPVGDDQWKITFRSRMPSPCNKKVMGTFTAKKMELAVAEARRVLDRAVKSHISGCKKCKANNIRLP